MDPCEGTPNFRKLSSRPDRTWPGPRPWIVPRLTLLCWTSDGSHSVFMLLLWHNIHIIVNYSYCSSSYYYYSCCCYYYYYCYYYSLGRLRFKCSICTLFLLARSPTRWISKSYMYMKQTFILWSPETWKPNLRKGVDFDSAQQCF